MDTNALQRRNSTLDIIRIVALTTVLSVHFFLHTGFYSEGIYGYGPIESIVHYLSSQNAVDLHGLKMFIMVMMRTLFGVCVPLFIILTGYLMANKTVSRKYYKGIRKTLIIFVLASIFCFWFKAFYQNSSANFYLRSGDILGAFRVVTQSEANDLKHLLMGIFDYTHANYSWYIEMYIGLFLMAPFLNLGYNKLKTKRQKQVLLATFIFLTILPTAVNIFNFDTASWWLNPRESTTYQKLIPGFWLGIYPITYYYTGMYLREYGMKPKTKSLIGLFGVSLLVFTLFNIFRSTGGAFVTGVYGFWYGFYPYVLAVLLFAILLRIKSDDWNVKVKFALWKVSDLVLGAYLMSYVTDCLIYDVLNAHVSSMTDKLPFFLITVPLSLIFSLALSYVLNLLYRLIIKAYDGIKAFVVAQRARDTGYMWQDILFFVLFATVLIVMFWKSVYGFGGSDESFYLTIPHRLVQGDALFADEWHLSQLSGFLLMPFTWFYTTVFGTTEGILLAARICYIIVHSLAVVLIYTRLRRYGYVALFGVVLYYLFTPYDIMALSYDSMGLELVILTGVLLGTADYDKKLSIIFSGLAFAAAVLCNPYLAVGYVLYAVCMVIHILLKNKEMNFALKSRMFAPRTFLWFTVGVGILAVIFMAFLLSRASIGDVFTNLPYMLEDPEHQSVTIDKKIGSYFTSIFKCHELFKYLLYCYGAALIAMIIDRKRRLHRSLYLVIAATISILSLILFLPDLATKSYNAVMFPMMFVTVTAYILCEKKPRELFVALFCLGVLYSICIHVTSNQYFYIISVALTASNLAGFVFLAQLIREMRANPDNISYALWVKRGAFVTVAFLILLQGGFQLSAKLRHVFWDASPESLTYEITDGPAKGLRTTQANYISYYQVYNDLQVYQNKERGNILFLTMTTHTYLSVVDYPYGTYSAWLAGENDNTLRRLKEYYALNPDKIPQYIYVPKSSGFNIASILNEARANGYTVSETNVSYQLEKAK